MKNSTTKKSTPLPQPFSLWLYLLVVCGLAWPLVIARYWNLTVLSRYDLVVGARTMLFIGTFIAGKYVFRDGFQSTWWQWGKLRHYFWILMLIIVSQVIPAIILVNTGKVQLPAYISEEQEIWIIMAMLVVLIPCFFEEFCWRGYLFPNLLKSYTPRKAVLVHAALYLFWGIPALFFASFQIGITSAQKSGQYPWISILAAFVLEVLIFGIHSFMQVIILDFIWMRSRSLVVTMLYHSLYEGLHSSFSYIFNVNNFGWIWTYGIIVILGLIILLCGNWKQLITLIKEDVKTKTLR